MTGSLTLPEDRFTSVTIGHSETTDLRYKLVSFDAQLSTATLMRWNRLPRLRLETAAVRMLTPPTTVFGFELQTISIDNRRLVHSQQAELLRRDAQSGRAMRQSQCEDSKQHPFASVRSVLRGSRRVKPLLRIVTTSRMNRQMK